MADGVPIDRLRQYLRELKPAARALLAAEIERAQMRGDEPPAAAFILEELRGDARRTGSTLTRIGNPQRLFFMPLEPFLVDDDSERKHRGRISRACLGPIWEWTCRDLMPDQARIYSDQVNLLSAANEKKGAEQVARAFQDLVEPRLRDVLATAKSDDKQQRRIAGQVGTPFAIENLNEIGAIFRVRDALGVMSSRLPATIGNLADEQLENAITLLDSPIARHRDVFLYSLLLVMSRLGSPWQLIRLAICAAQSDDAARIAETSFAVAVDVVLTDIDRMISTLRGSLKTAGGPEVVTLLRNIHDAARALHTEMDLSSDSPWARQLAASRATVAKLLEGEIHNVPGHVRRLLRPRSGREVGPQTKLDDVDVADLEAKLGLVAACRTYAGELAISEVTRRVHSELQTYLDTGTQTLLDRLRAAPAEERVYRQSQTDAAVRFCAKVFGSDYASVIAKAADVAARGEQKAAKG